MALLTIVAHPYEGSFAHAVAAALSEAPGNELIDLAASDFDPLLTRDELRVYLDGNAPNKDVAAIQVAIEKADALALVFPVWWGGPPAILKGLLDRVLLPEWAFSLGDDGTITGLLTWIRRVHIWCTLDSPDVAYGERTVRGMEQIMGETTFGFCGIAPDQVTWHVLQSISSTSVLDREEWLERARRVGRNPADAYGTDGGR